MSSPKADLVISDALVVTGDADERILPIGGVAVQAGKITQVGANEEMDRIPAERRIRASGQLLMPGLINMHCHASDSLFRGLVEDLPLEPWLQKIWKAQGAILTPETTRLAATLGFSECLLGGITTVMDMYFHPEETVRAARAVGSRVATGGIFFDLPTVDRMDVSARPEAALRFFENHKDADDVFPGTLPHGAYTVGPENLVKAREITDRFGGFYSTHAAETLAEQRDVGSRYGRSVIRYLDQLHVLDERTTLAHCVHVDSEEIAFLAQRKVTVSHNPLSNLKLGSGVAPIPEMLASGVRVALGTDGAISGNDLDMWLAMRLAATLHKGVHQNAGLISSREVFAMATRNGAQALGAADWLGSLASGYVADFLLLDVNIPSALPMFDPISHLVFSAARGDVRHVFVGGKQVVQDRQLVKVKITDTLEEVAELAPRIQASLA